MKTSYYIFYITAIVTIFSKGQLHNFVKIEKCAGSYNHTLEVNYHTPNFSDYFRIPNASFRVVFQQNGWLEAKISEKSER